MAAAPPLIFEIRRGSLEDGPGLRTTVFLKGCNLRCRWCHNPESLDPAPEIGFFPRDCIKCGDCVAACPASACSLENPRRIDREKCSRCGECVAACPGQALRMLGRSYDQAELLEILLRDKVFYAVSGGGVTLSGGEPTLYPDYLGGLLRQLQERGIHTAIQTNGLFRWDNFRRRVLPHADLVMMDLKLADPGKHREYTGRNNFGILANLRRLWQENPEKVLPRIPLIPGFTATAANLQALSRLLQELGVTRCALLPYNPTWFHKAESIGKPVDAGMSAHFLTPEELAACRQIFAWADLS